MANFAVAGVDMVTIDLANAAQMPVVCEARDGVLPIARVVANTIGANIRPP
jgi:hypothetical protein